MAMPEKRIRTSCEDKNNDNDKKHVKKSKTTLDELIHDAMLNLISNQTNGYYHPIQENMVNCRIVDHSGVYVTLQYYSELHKLSNDPLTYEYFMMRVCSESGNSLLGVKTLFKENSKKEIIDTDTNVVVTKDKEEFEKRFKEFVDLPCDKVRVRTFESFLEHKYGIDLVTPYEQKR